MNKSEIDLQLEIITSRMETCIARNDIFELTQQLLKYQVVENRQKYQELSSEREALAKVSRDVEPQQVATEQQPESDSNEDPLRKFTPEQAVVIAGYTGVTACKLTALRDDVSIRKGKKISYTALKKLTRQELEDLYKADFQMLCPVKNPGGEARLTQEQAVIVTGYTGKLLGDVGNFHVDLEKRLGRKIVNAELPKIGQDKISSLYKEDFQSLAL